MEKYHVYKCYRGSNYLGVIDNVISEFRFSHDINSPGSSMTMEVSVDIEVATKAIEAILDETGDPLLDENDGVILEERKPGVVGNTSENIQLRNGNVVEVYEHSNYHPNGKKMFSGVINRLEASFGGQSEKEVVTATVFSRGSELSNFIVSEGLIS